MSREYQGRVPFIFTSMLRMQSLGAEEALRAAAPSGLQSAMPVAAEGDNPSLWGRTAALAREVGSNIWHDTRDQTLSTLYSLGLLDEFSDRYSGAVAAEDARILGTAEDLETYRGPYRGFENPFISMMVNPNAMRVSLPKRIVTRRTRNGTAFMHFTDRRGRNNDYLTLTFSGTTGNINVNHGASGAPPPNNVLRELMWRDLIALANEPMVYVDESGRPRENKILALVTTKTFPEGLYLIGHFAGVPEFEESAEHPNMVNYHFSIVVHETSPDIGDMEMVRTELVPGPTPSGDDTLV